MSSNQVSNGFNSMFQRGNVEGYALDELLEYSYLFVVVANYASSTTSTIRAYPRHL